MNYFMILKEKLVKMKSVMTEIEKIDYLEKRLNDYEEYINRIIDAIDEGKLAKSNGNLLGMMGAISEYDVLCSNKELWDLAVEIDKFYSEHCK